MPSAWTIQISSEIGPDRWNTMRVPSGETSGFWSTYPYFGCGDPDLAVTRPG